MNTDASPTSKRCQLGAVLRKLRQAKGMTSTRAAALLLVSQPKMTRLELGQRRISQRDVRDLCRIYEVEEQQVVDALMQLARACGRQAEASLPPARESGVCSRCAGFVSPASPPPTAGDGGDGRREVRASVGLREHHWCRSETCPRTGSHESGERVDAGSVERVAAAL
ncbi:helix-turn-helix domain-containing protein [Streptomyces sp. So13.3]|nr:helix-turn-helix domain-containing protein [Streptomyces sp. So13.3]